MEKRDTNVLSGRIFSDSSGFRGREIRAFLRIELLVGMAYKQYTYMIDSKSDKAQNRKLKDTSQPE